MSFLTDAAAPFMGISTKEIVSQARMNKEFIGKAFLGKKSLGPISVCLSKEFVE